MQRIVASNVQSQPLQLQSVRRMTETKHALHNHRYRNEVIPIPDKAVAHLQALEQIDGLHAYGTGRGKWFRPESVVERVRGWLDGDDWGPGRNLTHHYGTSIPGWRARCLEVHPALAVHLALNSPAGGRALSAACALDVGVSIEEVARKANFSIPADTDPRCLRVLRAPEGRWTIVVVTLHRDQQFVTQPKSGRRQKRRVATCS